MGVVNPLGGVRERPELRAVKAASVIGVDFGPANVLRRVGLRIASRIRRSPNSSRSSLQALCRLPGQPYRKHAT